MPPADRPRATSRRALGIPGILLVMLLAVAAVASLAYWDERRESASALSDFAEEPVTLARAIAAAVSTPDEEESRDASTKSAIPSALLLPMRRVEHPGRSRVLVRRARETGPFVGTDGRALDSAELAEAVDHVRWVRVSREGSEALGLPRRTSVAGFGTVDGGALGAWTIAVVQTAERERDREIRAGWRLIIAVLVASGLVLSFGGLALRRQRRQLAIAHELAVAEAERIRDERLVQADKLATMGALATGIAHEVSTPLGVIVGRAERIAGRAEDLRTKRAATAIVEQAEGIGQIIRGFLTLARGDAPALERVEPASVVRKALELCEHRYAKGGVSLRETMDPSLPAIACEPRLLAQALVNLLLNACDACAPGGHVEMRAFVEGGSVVFAVTDDGEGIPPEDAARVVDPFFTTKPAGRGTGLGLAIANELVKHHRGQLSLEARGDVRGTRASVRIPAAEGVAGG